MYLCSLTCYVCIVTPVELEFLLSKYYLTYEIILHMLQNIVRNTCFHLRYLVLYENY